MKANPQRKRIRLPKALRGWVQRPEWLLAFGLATVVVVLVVAANATLSSLHPGSRWGLAYGLAATALMLAAALLGVRRRTMRWGLGRSQTWVQLHVYGGTLFLLLVLAHAGFRWPRETLGLWLFALSAWVVGSGLVGVAIRRWIPRVLASGLSTEVLFERIPELSQDLAARAGEVAASAPPPVRDFYRKSVAPLLGTPRTRWIFLLDVTGGIERRLRTFEFLRRRLPAAEQEAVEKLEALLRAQLELDAHWTLQRPLRLWLMAHVPVSLVLLLLVGLHVGVVLYY